MNTRHRPGLRAAVAVAPLAALAALWPTRGALSSNLGIYFPGITRSTPACGACHAPSPGAALGFAPIRIELTPSRRVLAAGQATGVSLRVFGGQSASTRGGFALESTGGVFSAGVDTNVVAPGNVITHFNSPTRAWTFGFTAPATPGLVEWHCVTNTVNDNAVNDDGDMWAFHGSDDTATVSTPVRVYVNVAGVTAVGEACVGAFGNVPVLGARQAPLVGNSAFALELFGVVPAAGAGLVLGASAIPGGLDLGPIGAPSCRLFVDAAVLLTAVTGAGDARRGEGVATFALPVPADPALAGSVVHAQAFVADNGHGRSLPLTFSNGVSVTLR